MVPTGVRTACLRTEGPEAVTRKTRERRGAAPVRHVTRTASGRFPTGSVVFAEAAKPTASTFV